MIEHHPTPEPDRTTVDAPIRHVTVLEDRALVQRSTTLDLPVGFHRLVVEGLAPVLQDVSLRATSQQAEVTDVRARRMLRIRRSSKPAEITALDDALEKLAADHASHQADQRRAESRLTDVQRMLELGVQEIPEDAVWGTVDPSSWTSVFDALFTRRRDQLDAALNAWFATEDVVREGREVLAQRAVADRLDQHVSTWALVDLQVDVAGPIELILEYVVPNALWRPLHRAELHGDTLRFTSRAALWQNTGEDWTDVELSLSTAQGSLGSEPPHLADDPLTAQRRAEDIELAVREVAVQSAGPAGPQSSAVDLPGVDDGGEVQLLVAPSSVTVPDGGRPVFIDLETHASPCTERRVGFPEIDSAVHIAVDTRHTGSRPLLAGPVELVRDNGPVGFATTLFVAPGAPMELGFGPDDAVRVQRTERVRKVETDRVDRWERTYTEVSLFLSNLGDEPVTLTLTERVPVSEVEHVQIGIDAERSTPDWTLDEANGFVVWQKALAAHDTAVVTLDWSLAVAPGAKLA